jgi:hypothetical protein
LPSGAPIHVALRYARGNAVAAARAAGLAASMRGVGIAVDGAALAARREVRPGARYFFAEDRDAADAVLRAAGLPGRGVLSDAAGGEVPPRPGQIELTMPPSQAEAGGRREPPGDGRS